MEINEKNVINISFVYEPNYVTNLSSSLKSITA